MSSKLDMALGDIIENDNKEFKAKRSSQRGGRGGRGGNRGGRGGNRGGGRGGRDNTRFRSSRPQQQERRSYQNPLRRGDEEYDQSGPVRNNERRRPTPYDRPQYDDQTEDYGSKPVVTRTIHKKRGYRVNIFGLPEDMPSEELQEIFAPIGGLTEVIMKCDQDDRPIGEAAIVFATEAQAMKAVQEFNQASIDHKPITVELAQPPARSIVLPPSAHSAHAAAGAGKAAFFGTAQQSEEPPHYPEERSNYREPRDNGYRGNGHNDGYQRGASRRGSSGYAPRGAGGRGRGQGRSARTSEPPKTEAELDAELEAYRNQRSA